MNDVLVIDQPLIALQLHSAFHPLTLPWFTFRTPPKRRTPKTEPTPPSPQKEQPQVSGQSIEVITSSTAKAGTSARPVPLNSLPDPQHSLIR